jgi:hypothetical protein
LKNFKIDHLDLIMELKDIPGQPVDTVYLQRERAGRSGNNHYAGIDRKPGIKFKSTELLKLRMREIKNDWKSFVPQAYVGNGDLGLWFFAWSAIGWELKDGEPAYQIERLKNGNVRVRIRLIAGPIDLSKKRSLEFALQAVPVKPNAARYRTCVGEDWVFHDATGFRFYGRSVDSFDTNSKDREPLRKYLLYGNRYNSKPTSWVGRHWVRNKQVQDLEHLSLYGSTILCGAGAPEFRTFGGEWLGNSNWQPNPKTKFSDTWNYQKTVRWGETPQQMTVRFINWTESFTDFFVWYYDKLIDECGVNGTWWDDQQLMIIHEYNPETGKMEEKFSTLARRNLCKRLNVTGWKHVRPPCWILNMHSDFPWCQLFWMVESSWYCDGENTTAPMHFSSIDVFRSMTRTKSTMMPVKCWLHGYEGTTPEMNRKVKRSLVAMLASHDIFEARMSKNTDEGNFLRKMASVVNLPDTKQCLFTGYWRTKEMVQPSDKQIVASVFTNQDFKMAAVLFYNLQKDQDQFLAGSTIDPSKLLGVSGPVKVKRVFDVETGKDINTVFEDGKIKITEQTFIPWHDYRVIGIEME